MPGRIWGQWRCSFSTCSLRSSAITDPLSPLLLQVCLVFPNASVRHDYVRIRFSLDLKLQLSRWLLCGAGGFSHCFPLLVSVPDALLWKTARFLTSLSDKLNRMCKRQESPLSGWYNNFITSLKKARKLINMELLSLKFTVPSCFCFFFSAYGGGFLHGYGILIWFKWKYTCPQRTEHMAMCKHGNKQTVFSVLISLLGGAEAAKHRVNSTALVKCINWPKMLLLMYLGSVQTEIKKMC